MKKLLLGILTFIITVISVVDVFAVSDSGKYSNNGSITLKNMEIGNTYSIYQMLKLESYDNDKEAYIYKVDPSSKWYNFLTLEDGKNYVNVENGTNIVTWKNEADAKAFASIALEYAKKNNISATKSIVATTKTHTFTELYLGYYLVDSSLGSLCNLTTTKTNAEVKEKNGITTIIKEVKEDKDDKFGATNNAMIGDTINFRTTINVANGAENYKLYDVMENGLTYLPSSLKIVLERANTNDKVLANNKDYSLINDKNYTFVIDFSDDLEKTLLKDDKLIITYDAILNEKAIIGNKGNKNETYLTYGNNNKTSIKQTRTYTFSFNLIKTDNKGVELTNAEFELYDSLEKGNKINLVNLGNNIYRVATKEEINVSEFKSAIITAGNVTINGLDDNKLYYLEEIKSPNGYNKLSSRIEVQLQATILEDTSSKVVIKESESLILDYNQNTLTVINIPGSLLPTTGGKGTTIFVIIGSAITTIFGILLIAKFKMSKSNEQ